MIMPRLLAERRAIRRFPSPALVNLHALSRHGKLVPTIIAAGYELPDDRIWLLLHFI